MTIDPKIIFFKTPADFRKWLEKNHSLETELYLGFYKKNSGKKSITWSESIDQALCYGWIDGVHKRIDEKRYYIRFTPRKKTSSWSAVNLNRVKELSRQKLMKPSGIKIYAERKVEKDEKLSFKQTKIIKLDPAYEKIFRRNKQAWKWFSEQVPSYKKAVIMWVMSAKQEKTRLKRMAFLIIDSNNGERIKPMRYHKKRG